MVARLMPTAELNNEAQYGGSPLFALSKGSDMEVLTSFGVGMAQPKNAGAIKMQPMGKIGPAP